MYKTIDDVRINGKMYERIILGNNLIADILPPPNYIIEPYLLSYELLYNIMDSEKVDASIAYLEGRLIPEYQERYDYWMKDTIYLKDSGTLKALYTDSVKYAQQYFKILEAEYIPAIKNKDDPTAQSIFASELKPAYDEHRKIIDQLVAEANKENSAIESSAAAILYNSALILALVSLVYLAFFAVSVFFLTGNINVALKKNIDLLKNLSEGDGDLTKTLETTSKDELGVMANYFNLTLRKIRDLIILVQGQSSILDTVGEDLSENMSETSSAINQITANIQSIKNQTVNQAASVAETSATMEQISNGLNKLNKRIEDQSQHVKGSSSAIEEMLANIESVTQTLIKNAENMRRLSASSELGKTVVDKITTAIQDVAQESKGLMEISKIIQNIASQTNLLSMNAAIEAAHAGAAGKGFAVVADEIRKLAESSSSQTKTIGSILKKISDSMAVIIEYSKEVVTKFTIIETEVKAVALQEESIRRSMAEQSEGSKLVLESINALNDISQKVQAGSLEMLTGSKQVSIEAKNMNEITQEISGGMNEMASGAEQVRVAVDMVSELSAKNKASIEALVDEMNKFKV